jgi:hypothetical protein
MKPPPLRPALPPLPFLGAQVEPRAIAAPPPLLPLHCAPDAKAPPPLLPERTDALKVVRSPDRPIGASRRRSITRPARRPVDGAVARRKAPAWVALLGCIGLGAAVAFGVALLLVDEGLDVQSVEQQGSEIHLRLANHSQRNEDALLRIYQDGRLVCSFMINMTAISEKNASMNCPGIESGETDISAIWSQYDEYSASIATRIGERHEG